MTGLAILVFGTGVMVGEFRSGKVGNGIAISQIDLMQRAMHDGDYAKIPSLLGRARKPIVVTDGTNYQNLLLFGQELFFVHLCERHQNRKWGACGNRIKITFLPAGVGRRFRQIYAWRVGLTQF